MATTATSRLDDSFVFQIYEWYRSAMLSVGNGISFPKGTDPTKTYTFRAVKKFAQKMVDWEFDESTIRLFIQTAVRYAKNRKLLSKGAYLLTMNSVLEVCYEELQHQMVMHKALDSELVESHQFMQSLGSTRSEIYRRLRRPISYGGCNSLIYYYNTDKISISYISLSIICGAVLSKINLDERSEVPTDIDLLKLRVRLLSDYDNLVSAQKILKNDLNVRGIRGEK